ncbi:tRNA (N6-isopentenyl adenosine(37)-C2)-methylthiotransferase MiaB, partial [Candidatus Fermentibacterales bacterium]|nr:tRNA (N6-isopentenyl adenosine(37)-C2)-methylthiotransferase MiaB [Candidatus Fermentibacterales bacterium]
MSGAAGSRGAGSYCIEVYGCQMNQHDAEIISGIMLSAGYVQCSDPVSSDVVIVVTCAVREHAERRALGRLSQLAGRRRGREGSLAVCGCVAQEHGEGLLSMVEGVDFVVGPDCYTDIPSLLRLPGGSRVSLTELRGQAYDGVEPARSGFPRAYVTIMTGCDNYCSYCIVPYVRGREQSRDPGAILDEVGRLAEAGYGEITLLGQNVNSYRSGGLVFSSLLRMVAEAALPARVRFVTSHPRDLGEDIVAAMADSPNVCRQLHLPLQSGDDDVLARMGRGYDTAHYTGVVRSLREAMPGIELSTDILVGFPGETAAAFERTMGIMEEIAFDYAFLFRFSPRSGTAAAGMSDQIPETERLRRLSLVQELQRALTLESSRALIGSTVRV